MMWNRHKNKNSSFFWGIVAGAAGGLWVANKMMNKSHAMNEESHHSLTHEHHQGHHHNSSVGDLTNLEGKQKEALFDTFLHGSKEDLVSKAQEFHS